MLQIKLKPIVPVKKENISSAINVAPVAEEETIKENDMPMTLLQHAAQERIIPTDVAIVQPAVSDITNMITAKIIAAHNTLKSHEKDICNAIYHGIMKAAGFIKNGKRYDNPEPRSQTNVIEGELRVLEWIHDTDIDNDKYMDAPAVVFRCTKDRYLTKSSDVKIIDDVISVWAGEPNSQDEEWVEFDDNPHGFVYDDDKEVVVDIYLADNHDTKDYVYVSYKSNHDRDLLVTLPIYLDDIGKVRPDTSATEEDIIKQFINLNEGESAELKVFLHNEDGCELLSNADDDDKTTIQILYTIVSNYMMIVNNIKSENLIRPLGAAVHDECMDLLHMNDESDSSNTDQEDAAIAFMTAEDEDFVPEEVDDEDDNSGIVYASETYENDEFDDEEEAYGGFDDEEVFQPIRKNSRKNNYD